MKGRKETVQSRLDPKTQEYVDNMRQFAQQAAGRNYGPIFTGPITATPQEMAQPFLNPFQDVLRSEFDRARAQAVTTTQQEATAAGAYGGSRHGVAEGQRLAGIDEAQARAAFDAYNRALNLGMGWTQYNQGLQQQKNMEQLFLDQAKLGMLAGGLGPYGMDQTTQTREDPWKYILGAAQIAAPFLLPATAPAAAATVGGSGGMPIYGGSLWG